MSEFKRGLPLSRTLSALSFLLVIHVHAQTTQGIISGRLLDSRSGRAIAGASVSYRAQSTDTPGVATTDAQGFFYLPLLSPGFYNIRAAAEGYQAQELQDLELGDLQDIDPHFERDFYDFVKLESVLALHDVAGGTAPVRVRQAIAAARKRLSRVEEETHAHA